MSSTLYDIAPLIEPLTSGAVILTPNQRLARRIRTQWDANQLAQGHSAWQVPSVFAQQQWLEMQWERAVADRRLPPRQRITETQARQLWRRVLQEEGASGGELALLEPSAAADLAANARNTLLGWQVDWQARQWRHLFNLDPDCETYARWLAKFEAMLTQAGLCTMMDCIAALARQPQKWIETPVFLLECGGAPPVFEAAMAAICSRFEHLPLAEPSAHKRFYAFDDQREQLMAVADWAAKTRREEPDTRIGIVLTDMERDRLPLEYMLRRAFDCMGREYTSLPVNFSTGIPLSHAPVVRDALRALALGLQRTTVPNVVQVLNSRYLALPDSRSPLALHFVEQLYANGAESLDTARLRTRASEVQLGDEEGLALGRILVQLSSKRMAAGKALPGEWAARFLDVLAVWGWPAEPALDSLEYQQVTRWYELLDEFKSFDAVTEPLDYAGALALLEEFAREAVSQPQTLDSNIQVLGPLEAIGLQFDHLWLVGMQASRWPQVPRPNPFLPIQMQISCDMPRASARREWDVAALRLAQYSRAAGTIHATYVRQDEGIVEFPSPQLAEFAAAELPTSEPVPLQWIQRQASASWESLDDSMAPPVVAEPGAAAGGSALLEDQSQCPFRAFARRRLHVEPLGEFSMALSAAERGLMLHDALKALWRVIVSQERLLVLEPVQLDRLVAEAAHEGLARVHRVRGVDLVATYWNLERSRLERLLHQWLELERTRSAFVVQAREEKVDLAVGQLTLKLQIDRIDTLPDGSSVIMDYKSSASTVSDWMGDRPAKPQLLLYGLASQALTDGPVAGLAFAQVRADDCKFVGLGKTTFAPGVSTDLERYFDDDDPADQGVDRWAQLNARWVEVLHRLADAFLAGEAAVDPLKSTSCTWCGLQPLCRIDRSSKSEQGA